MPISSALGISALLPGSLGFRNVLINGGFDVWQRGTSTAFTSTPSTSFLADRWSGYRNTTGSTQSRISAGLDGFQYALRMQRDSGNTSASIIYIGQSLETSTATKLANKPVVLSFYARAGANYSSASNALRVLLYSGTGTEANGVHVAFTSSTNVISTTATLTTSWQRFTYFATMPATSSQLTVQLDWTPSGTAGAADYADITGVQLEQNYQPTPFEQRPIGVELGLCQRYYYQSARYGTTFTLGDANPPPIAQYSSAAKIANAWWWYQAQLPVPMRVAPSASFSDGAGTAGKLMFATDTGGSASNNNSLYTAYSAPTHVIVTVYTQGGYYGVFASVKADAEL